MKKIITCFSMVFIATMMFAQERYVQQNNAFKVEYSDESQQKAILRFNLENYAIKTVEHNGVKYSTIDFENGINTFKKGYAELPMVNINLLIDNTNDVNFEVLESDFIEINLDYPMLPSRGTIYRNQDPKSIPFIIYPESIVDEWYPESFTEATEPFVFRDTRGVNLYMYPFGYNAVKKTLKVYRSVAMSITRDKLNSTNGLTRNISEIAPVMNDVYKSLYLNYSPTRFANQMGELGEMLVIYTSRDASAIQPYINWKREKGFKVLTQQVTTGTNVKTTIQNAYNSNNNLLYVQLVGDWPDIKSDLGTTQNAPMDPMLGCVAGSDYYPDLIIGRFSASSSAQVTIQVNKAINYEKNPDMGVSWYKNGLGIASNEGPGDDNEYDNQHMDIIKNNKLLPYTYTNIASQYQPSATASGVASSVNSGVSIINYVGHGSETSWGTSGYSTSNINSSTNGSKLPFIFSVACVNGKFHRTTGDCFAEAWLNKENGGAVAVIMSTINQAWHQPMRGQDYMNDILIGGYNYSTNPGNGSSTNLSDKRTTFGSIAFNGNVLMLAEQYTDVSTKETFQTWTIFGDASIQVRTDTPKPISVNAENINGSPYSVTVTSNGSPVSGANVSLYQNGNTYTATTNTSGIASVTHNFTSGTATVTVTGYNCGAYQTTKTIGGSSVTIPSTPTGLTTSNITSSGATLSWSAASGATSYDVQFRQQGGAWSTSNVTGTSTNATGLAASTTYEWQVSAKNSAGNSAYSAAKSFATLASGGVTYCTSMGNSYSYEWISKVVIGSFTNSSGAAGYTDFTSKTITMTAGTGYSIALTPTFASTAYNEYWKVWVDLNGNGVFDANELLFDAGSLSTTTVTGTITIPAGTPARNTRMRVSMKYNGAQTACETFSYGEVEDYTVQIVAGSTNPPATPTGLNASSINTSSATLTWSASVGATSYDVQFRQQGGTWSTSNVTGTSVNKTGLAAMTAFEWQVRANNVNGSSAYSAIASFTTLSATISYCTSKGNNASSEWIQRVVFSGIDNNSGKNSGYANFTNLTATVARGETLPINIQTGFASSLYTEYWSIWIDFNQNGTFDSDERVVYGSSKSSNLLSANVSIPTTAMLGSTRMRVSMKYNAAQTACETFSYGEVEDYTVNVLQTRANNNAIDFGVEQLGHEDQEPFVIYPNPASDRITVSLQGLMGDVMLRIYDLQGRMVKDQMLTNLDTEINISDLANGVYIISVDEEKMPLNKRFVKM